MRTIILALLVTAGFAFGGTAASATDAGPVVIDVTTPSVLFPPAHGCRIINGRAICWQDVI